MANAQITYARLYDPCGVVSSTSGSSQTAYACIGEYYGDYNELVYLRARYYTPSTGRFLTKDTWYGDYNSPLTLNRWNYVTSNPINYTDPSSNVPSVSGIESGQHVYSCNCGWIDFTHARPNTADKVLDLLKQERIRFSQPASGIRTDAFAISPDADVMFPIGNVSITAVVRRGLDGKTRESVALGIYRVLQEQVEYKEKPPWAGNFQSWSYYSLEDLTSDEIGFYLALAYGGEIDPTHDDGKNGDAWRYLARVCGFSEDRKEARDRSLEVYNSYGMNTFEWYFTKTPRVFTWGSPLLCTTDVANNYCADKAKQWPAEFTSVIPTTAQRDGLWWMYDKKQDGKLLPTDYTGFNFLAQ